MIGVMQRYEFDSPERFVVGTVGLPGERTFFLQARDGSQTITVGLEKTEVTALADGLAALLGQLGRTQGVPIPLSGEIEVDLGPLESPVEEDFRLGQLTVSWDGRRVFVEAAGLSPGASRPADDAPELDSLKVGMSPAQTLAFIERARSVVAAGRPPCVLCGRPDSPSGHFCPRLN